MTQWIFTSSKCSCSDDDQLQRELKFCPICGLRVRGREGTMTGWIFRSKSCVCLAAEIIPHVELSTEDLPAEDLIEEEPFEWIAVAGQGGMGTVYKARDRKLGRFMAVKVMQQETDDPRAADTFLREARAASKLQHPNIVTVSDFGIMRDGRQFLAIEWIDGITLADYLTRHGTLSVEAAREIFVQILDGLSHAHKRGVIHRDIKPKNIMLSLTTSGGWTVKLIDFGTAKDLTQEGFQTRAEDMACSPYYVSPERVNGLIVDHRADLYSLGCTYFEALVGNPPFRGAAMPVVMMHLNTTPPTLEEASGGKPFPLYLEQTIAKLLSKKPEERFADAEETKKALEERFVEESSELNFGANRLNAIGRSSDEGTRGSDTTDGYRADGYRADGYSADGYRADGYRADGYRAGGYPGSDTTDSYRTRSRGESSPGLQSAKVSPATALVATVAILCFGTGTWFLISYLTHSGIESENSASKKNTKRKKTEQKTGMTELSTKGDFLTGTDGQSVFIRDGVKVSVTSPTKEEFLQLKAAEGIEHITMANCYDLPKRTFTNLSSRNTLSRLDFDICVRLEPAILAPIGEFPKLQHVCITDCTFEPGFLSALKPAKNLNRLDVKYCTFAPDKVADINVLPQLKIVKLPGCSVTDEEIDTLQNLKEVQEYDLGENSIKGSCFKNMQSKNTIQRLILHHLPIQTEALAYLKDFSVLTGIEYDNNLVGTKDIKYFAAIPKLTSLSLPHCQLSPDAYPELGKMTKLTHLSLADTATSDTDLAQLSTLTNLAYIDLAGTNVTPAGLAKVRTSWKKLENLDANFKQR
jgi:serine/threonine protein kinase